MSRVTTVSVRVFTPHPVVAAEYVRALSSQRDLRVVGEQESFQVGVFDSEPNSAGPVLTLARLKFPSMRPVLVSSPCSENECLRWLFRGVWGLVSYDRYQEELPQAVLQVAEGHLWFPAPVVLRWMKLDDARRASALQLPLTPREREVMEFLLRRFSNKEIAEILNISERTIKFHVGNILSKLHVDSRQELATRWVPTSA